MRRQRVVVVVGGGGAPHAHPGAQPRGPFRVPAGHTPVVPAGRARPVGPAASRVHDRAAGRRGRAGPAGARVPPARRHRAGQFPRGVPQPDVQARDGPVVVRGTLWRGRGRGQDGRRHRGERVRAKPGGGPRARQRPGRVRDPRQARPGRAQQVVRDPRRVRGRRVPAVPVRLAVRGGRAGRPAPVARRPARRAVPVDRRPVRDGRAGRPGRRADHRGPAAGVRDGPGPGALLRAPPAEVRLPGGAYRRRSCAPAAVRRAVGAVRGRQRFVRRVPQVQAPPSVPGLVEKETGPARPRQTVRRDIELTARPTITGLVVGLRKRRVNRDARRMVPPCFVRGSSRRVRGPKFFWILWFSHAAPPSKPT